ncbi:MAG: prepilin-type N-terminal cleavage/methylation domain-containing protein [Planctomycetota bacterium]
MAPQSSISTPCFRRGFTLVELLVVMAIFAVIATIGIYAMQPFSARSTVTNSGIIVQQWLNAAKMRAVRNRVPCGIRLLPGDEIVADDGTPLPSMVTKCVFIEQPDDILGAGIVTDGADKMRFTLPANSAMPATLPPRSFLEVNGGTLHEIESGDGTTIRLVNQFPYAIPQNSGVLYRIILPPLISTSTSATASTQEVLRLQRGSAINLTANSSLNVAPNNVPANFTTPYALSVLSPPLDIMFAPNGAVTTANINGDKIALWITGTRRNNSTTLPIDPMQGQPTIVVIATRTGAIGAFPADMTPGGNPYSQVP